MLPKIPFLPGGLALIASACAVSQPGTRRTSPIDHTFLRGEQLHTERQILEARDINVLTGFGNLATLENRNLSAQLSSVLEAPEVDGVPLKLMRLVQQNSLLIVAYGSPELRGALSLIDLANPENPVLRAELQLPTVSIEQLTADGKQIYFAGSSSDPGGPVIGRISFQDFEWQDDLKLQVLDMKQIRSIAVLQDRVLVADASGSQVTALQKKDFVTMGQLQLPGVSEMVPDRSSLWTLSRAPTQITQLDAGLHPLARIAAGGEMKLFSGQLAIGQETVLATLGEGGVQQFCKEDQKPLFSIPSVVRAELSANRMPSVGAALSHGLLLTAHAEAGVSLFQVTTHDKQGVCKGRDVHFEGYLDLGKSFRAESLSWQGGVLSVGDDQGRLNFILIEAEELDNDDMDFDG